MTSDLWPRDAVTEGKRMTRLGACDAMKSGEWQLPGRATVTGDENATSPEVIADRFRRAWVRSDALFRLVAPDAMLTRPGDRNFQGQRTRAGRQPSPQPISESGRWRGTVSRAQLRCQGPGGPMPEPKGPKSGGPGPIAGREVGVGGLGAGPIVRTDVRGLGSRAANPGGRREARRLAKPEAIQKCTQPWFPGVDSHQAAAAAATTAQQKVECEHPLEQGRPGESTGLGGCPAPGLRRARAERVPTAGRGVPA